jgi:2-haloacid dehalogenase
MTEPRALLFDVFGTVVDWRSGVARDALPFLKARGLAVRSAEGEARSREPAGQTYINAFAFADAWRARYQPAMEEVRAGRRPFQRLDLLHRENLEAVLRDHGIDPAGVPEAELDHLNRAWHRLDAWPDSIPGLTRLKTRFIIAPLSNGNVALLLNMAKRAGLPWDAILGAEVAGAYKPQREAYTRTAEILGLQPAACMMVAAHNGDLAAAQAAGLATAFVTRATEHGPKQRTDLGPTGAWDIVASDFEDLADQLGCAA